MKPLDRFPSIRTRNAEEMRAFVLSTGATSLEFPQGDTNLVGHSNRVALRNIALTFCSYSVPIELTFSEGDYFRQQFCVSGSAITHALGKSGAINDNMSYVSPAAAKLHFGSGYEQIALRISKETVEQKLRYLLGYNKIPAIRFDAGVNLDNPHVRHLRNLVWFLVQTLGDVGFSLPAISLDELEDAVVVAFLLGIPSNISQRLAEPSRTVSPWQVKQVEDYIEEHWAEPITIEVLTRTLDVSARAIFSSFTQRGYSPMIYLRKVRLGHARSMLLNANYSVTVASVAAKCGFADLGHFAKHYRETFGELPSETLNRVRGKAC